MIVFDAGALIALVNAEAGDGVVRQLLINNAGSCFIHAVNLLEVCYNAEREHGPEYVATLLQLMAGAGIETRGDFDPDFLRDASFLKVNYKMSLADTFGLSLARRLGCPFASTDHHELDAVKIAGVCDVLFIR